MTLFRSKERAVEEVGSEGRPVESGVCLNNRALAESVLEAVRCMDEKELSPSAPRWVGIAFQPRLMLAALTYCYALGVLAAQDIEEMMLVDKGLRALCGMEFPDWRCLRRFRRDHHLILQHTLEETFRRAWSLNHCDRAGDERSTRVTATALESDRDAVPANDWFAREAESRLEQARFIDRMSMED